MVVGEVAVETDVVVIGGGPGGYAAAIRLGQLGQSVVLIEKEELGGVCLNRGCIPSKALIHAAGEYHKLAGLGKLGIQLPEGEASFHMPKWQTWKASVVNQLSSGVAHLCQANGVTVVKGSASFLSNDRIGVETGGDFETYKFRHAIVAAGSRPYIPPFLTPDHLYLLDSTDVLNLQEIPNTLAIIGGGYIGMEMGMAFAKLGTKVTILEAADRILPQTASHLSQEVWKQAKKLGIIVKTGTRVETANVANGRVVLELLTPSNVREQISTDKALVTIGRVPNTKDIGLTQAGVMVDERGYIPVDPTCRTSIPHIYAIGDVTPGPALAHRASKQGIVAAEVITGMPSSVDSPYVPYVIFTEPQIAGVGLTREEAEQQGYQVTVASFPYRANGKALSIDEKEGFAEVIVDEKSHLLLGMHVVGADASNLIGEGALALEMAARVEDLALTVHPHPTLSEVWLEAAEAALGHAIHIVNKTKVVVQS
ncbi:dihydrolipoyl dehydrogenase [Brevibacillus choshinensis]|uniref:dihydrolipoyl dehydrogenase n=1 Tax=Brevibacillus choshinensis TaxID=54911 RepID=UPI002E218FE5|nr:dihydrolipoyl dehydrogenase [Brevibacillus choshinensis]MED4750752.1 dihydrolipoyl dehydrogenase [Brevibacillus choshinensis]